MIRDLLPHTIWLYTKSQSKNQKSKIDNHQIPTLPPPSALPYSPKKKTFPFARCTTFSTPIERNFSNTSNRGEGFPLVNNPLGPEAFSSVTRAAPPNDARQRNVQSAAKRVCCRGSTLLPRGAMVSGETNMGLSVKLRIVAMMSGPV